jgi:ribosome-associated translation inhibitor RaiA
MENAEEQNTAVDKVNEAVSLGGNIELVGFKQVSMADVVVVKKLVGHYTRKIQEHSQNFEKVQISLKEIHKIDNNAKHEIHVKAIDAGKAFSSEVVDKNIFIALDEALKKVLAEITHHSGRRND